MSKSEVLLLPSSTAPKPETRRSFIAVGQSAERGGGCGSGAAQSGLNDGGGAAGGAVRGGRGAVGVRAACGAPGGEGPVLPSRLRPGALRVLHPGVLLPVGAWPGAGGAGAGQGQRPERPQRRRRAALLPAAGAAGRQAGPAGGGDAAGDLGGLGAGLAVARGGSALRPQGPVPGVPQHLRG